MNFPAAGEATPAAPHRLADPVHDLRGLADPAPADAPAEAPAARRRSAEARRQPREQPEDEAHKREELYDYFLDRFKRDLLAEREQMGHLIIDNP